MTSDETRKRSAEQGRASSTSAPPTGNVSVRDIDLGRLTNWRPATTSPDALVSLVAIWRSPRVAGRLDTDTVSACREIVRLDVSRTRAGLLTALVDADAVELDTTRRVLTRYGWPDTLNLADAVILAWRDVIEQRRRYLDAELTCAHTVATRRLILTELIDLEREAA